MTSLLPKVSSEHSSQEPSKLSPFSSLSLSPSPASTSLSPSRPIFPSEDLPPFFSEELSPPLFSASPFCTPVHPTLLSGECRNAGSLFAPPDPRAILFHPPLHPGRPILPSGSWLGWVVHGTCRRLGVWRIGRWGGGSSLLFPGLQLLSGGPNPATILPPGSANHHLPLPLGVVQPPTVASSGRGRGFANTCWFP